MELKGSTFVQQPIDKVWAALNNEEILRQCITGCESLERVDDQTMSAKLAVKIGPVRARFNGKVSMADVQALQGYTLHFEGSGGAAGFAKGSSQVALQTENAGTRIDYTTQASIGGKLGQVGGRMIDATARSMADDFFAAFANCLGPAAAATDSATATAAGPSAADSVTPSAAASAAPEAGQAATAASAPATTLAKGHASSAAALAAPASPARADRLTWFIAGMIASAVLMLLGKHLL